MAETKQAKINVALASEVRAEMEALSLTQKRVEDESGITLSTLRRILSARVDINVPDLTALVRVFNKYRVEPMTPADLINRAIARVGGLEAAVSDFEPGTP